MSKLSDWAKKNVEVHYPFEDPLKYYYPLGKTEPEKIKVYVGGGGVKVFGQRIDPNATPAEKLRVIKTGCLTFIIVVLLTIFGAIISSFFQPTQPAPTSDPGTTIQEIYSE